MCVSFCAWCWLEPIYDSINHMAGDSDKLGLKSDCLSCLSLECRVLCVLCRFVLFCSSFCLVSSLPLAL